MACVSEAIGLALPGSAGAPAPYDSRDAYAEASGQQVMELVRLNLRPRDIVTRKSLENAATVVAAAGGSTNSGLHLPAIAHEAGIDFDLHEVGRIFARTPYIGNLKPGGEYVMKDLYEIGGVPILMKTLLDGGYLHGDCITVTGKTIAENLKDVVFPTGQNVILPTSSPFSPTGGVVVLKGKVWTGLLGMFIVVLLVIGAVRLSRPHAPWARWRYTAQPDKMRRALQRERRLRRPVVRAKLWVQCAIAGTPRLPDERTVDAQLDQDIHPAPAPTGPILISR